MITALIVFAILLALASMAFSIHVAILFTRFNDGIKDWATRLDDATNASINRAARSILAQMDERINESLIINKNSENHV